MKINHKKTFAGSVVAFFLGTSCCWISSLVIWLGGATIMTSYAAYIGKMQAFSILAGVLLAGLSLFLFLKHRRENV